jgi:hypothetical protein
MHGGVLWSDAVNKRFYVFGGENTKGFTTTDFSLYSYNTILNKWDNYGEPKIPGTLEMASCGAGVGYQKLVKVTTMEAG